MKHASLMLKYLPILFLVVALESACHHEVAKNQPNSTPPAAAPTAAISANPPYIQHGQSTTLSWQTANASEINIQGLGSVPASGSRTLYPAESTTYELVAKGSGGEGTASARVTVNSAVSSSGNSGESDPGFLASVNDAFFDYDRFNIRPDAMSQIQKDAQYLNRHSSINVMVEGHCDERGSAEYNLALGAKRAAAVQKALVQLGVPNGHIKTVSYGKEKPFCSASNEQCWQENRRGHVVERQ